MSVLIYTEFSKGKIKKASLEAVNYGAKIASMLGTTSTALIVNCDDTAALADLGKAGANKVVHVKNNKLIGLDSQLFSQAIYQVAQAETSNVIVFSHDLFSKAVASRVAVKLKAGMVPGAVDYPTLEGTNFVIRKNVFSGKATADYVIKSTNKVISLLPNSFQVTTTENVATIAEMEVTLADSKIKIKEQKVSSSELSLPDAEIVVSAGRGLKGPENWGMVEDLAKSLGAATACSRPVSDIGWRPHHEHVGQTGIAIRPNLYIAIGISGAIQHLAGVNGSKTIVVINTDKEAPFFKAADYGIVGDAFEVVPRLTEAIKKFKANH